MTQVFVATKETQGRRTSDFCWCQEGELVTFSPSLDDHPEEIDGPSGNRRAMTGLVSHRATTTVKVVALEDGKTVLQAALRTFFTKAGWASLMAASELQKIIQADVEELTRLAAAFPLDSVVEIRGNEFITRKS